MQKNAVVFLAFAQLVFLSQQFYDESVICQEFENLCYDYQQESENWVLPEPEIWPEPQAESEGEEQYQYKSEYEYEDNFDLA